MYQRCPLYCDGWELTLKRDLDLASKVMSLADTGCTVLDQLPFKDLLSYSCGGYCSRQLVKTTLRLRFKSLLRTYVGFDVLAFRSLMIDVGAAISGSSVVWMLSPWGWNPGNLNMVVPRGKTELILNYFGALGYSQSTVDIDNVALLAISCVYHLRRSDALVIVLESKNGHIIHPVTCSLNSVQMNMMTPDEIIIFYPKMTTENLAMVGRRCYPSNQHCSKVPEHFSVIESCHFKGRCGRDCPALFRRLYGVDGMARFNWAEIWDEAGTFERLSFGCHHKWRLGSLCYNQVCTNSGNGLL
jgi:hypothetical protein